MDIKKITNFPLDQLESAVEHLENESDLTECPVLRRLYTEAAKTMRKDIRKRKRRIQEITDEVIARRSPQVNGLPKSCKDNKRLPE